MSFIVERIGRMFTSPKDLEESEDRPLGDTEVAAAAAMAAAAVESSGGPNRRTATSFAARTSSNPPPRMPSRAAIAKDSMARTRSLSKVFNSLPANLPSCWEMTQDMLEYLCHALLLEQDWKKSMASKMEIERAVVLVNSATEGGLERLERGRLFTRLKLAGLAGDFMMLKVPDDDEEEEDTETSSSKPRSSLSVTCSEWKELHERWVLVKTLMLRSDANVVVPFSMQQQQQHSELKEGESAIDSKLEEHEMFREDSQQVETLLQVQQVLACMRQALQQLQQQQQRRSSRRRRGIDAEVLKKIIKDTEQEWLQSAFGDPEELLPPKLEYVIAPLRAAASSPDADYQQAMKLTLERYKALVLNQQEHFSHHHLFQSVHSLVVKWAESVLEIPVLFRLGYGGVTAPLAETDNDDVSSWGDENAHERDKQMEQEEDLFCTQVPEEVVTKEIQLVRKAKFVAEKKPLLNRRIASRENVPEARRSVSPKEAPQQSKRVPPKAGNKNDLEAEDEWSKTQDPDEVRPSAKVSSPPSIGRKRGADVVSIPEVGDAESPSERQKKRRKVSFTLEEADAIREGVRRFGIGKWKIIKMSDSRLKHRTPVQIKDKFRNMLRAGEI